MKKLLASTGVVALSAVGLVAVSSTPVHAAQTLTVTTTDDENGPATDCTDGLPGTNCSLREALAAATADGDTVETQAGANYLLVHGQLEHGDTSLTIEGAGATIDAQGNSRVLVQGAGTLTVNDLTIANGYAASFIDIDGGGIEAQGAVVLDGVSVIDNEAHSDTAKARGGGVYAAGSVTLVDTNVAGNTAHSSGGPDSTGGGVYTDDTITAVGSSFVGNEARGGNGGFAGGFFAQDGVTLTSTAVLLNTAVFNGGGFMTQANATLDGVTLSQNKNGVDGDSPGGGAWIAGSLTMQDSTVSQNVSGADGGGVWVGEDTSITNSSILANIVSYGNGGGLAVSHDATITDSTVAYNAADFGSGGGIDIGGQLTLTNSTVTMNSAGMQGQNIFPVPSGGGVAAARVVLRFSTVASNQASVGANVSAQSLDSAASVVAYPGGGGADCAVAATSSAGYSYDDDGSCGFVSAHDVSNGRDPLLGPIADNGGATQTMHPLPGSPLVDAIRSGSCTGCVMTDQRGISRPQGTGYDIGAVEVIGVAVSPRFTG